MTLRADSANTNNEGAGNLFGLGHAIRERHVRLDGNGPGRIFPRSGSGGTFTFTPYVAGTFVVDVAAQGNDGSSGAATQVVTIATSPPRWLSRIYQRASSKAAPSASAAALPIPAARLTRLRPCGPSAAPMGSPRPAPEPTLAFNTGEDGTYTAALAVTDANDATTTATQTFSVSAIPLQPAIENTPNSLTDGVTFNLTAVVAGPTWDMPGPTAYQWTVTQNGNPYATGTGPTFTFMRLGSTDPNNYVVTLTVADNTEVGTAVANIVVAQPGTTVTAAPPTGSTEVLAVALGNDKLDARRFRRYHDRVGCVGSHDTLIGGAGTNILQGDSGFNSLLGGSGPNTLFGVGTDTLMGGTGPNLFQAMPAATGPLYITSGGSLNSLSFSLAATTGIVLNLNTQVTGTPQPIGGGAMLALSGQFQNVYGSATGNDSIVAGNGTNLFGGGGNDTLAPPARRGSL